MHEIYSIHAAARTAHVPVERLRRGILTGELIAQPVSDDRQYLVTGSNLRAFLGQPEKRIVGIDVVVVAQLDAVLRFGEAG